MIRDELKRYSISLPPELVAEIDKLARRARKHRGPFIAAALEDFVANRRLMHAREDADEQIRSIEERLEVALARVRAV